MNKPVAHLENDVWYLLDNPGTWHFFYSDAKIQFESIVAFALVGETHHLLNVDGTFFVVVGGWRVLAVENPDPRYV